MWSDMPPTASYIHSHSMFEDYKKFLIKLATIFPWLPAKRLSIDPAVFFSVFLTHLSLKSVSAGDPLLKLSKILFFFWYQFACALSIATIQNNEIRFRFYNFVFFSLHFTLNCFGNNHEL